MSLSPRTVEIPDDRVLRDMLADAKRNHPERAWKESIMAAAFKVRWAVPVVLSVLSAVVAIAAVAFIASPAFRDGPDAYARIALVGVAPALAILAVACAAQASSRVLHVRWVAVLLGVLGAVATSVAYELWYAGVDGTWISNPALLISVGVSVLLYGGALAALTNPALREMPSFLAVVVFGLVVLAGGSFAVFFAFPMFSTVLVAAAAIVTVLLMRRGEQRKVVVAPA
ncbi:hypothetical protein PTQ19_08275 [Microbacterium esteraromaticum]|uniref:hypothetical protein n=1 Tax=Microbacterium esteraromaticum TaxID=57043 RepID=UPI0023682C0F|nr:hypothetical protein [Microbacterium esteraromaticum]WDH77535.1 hypothetical protein PTQ19_08275 [Microbacterium esteraromaticum]